MSNYIGLSHPEGEQTPNPRSSRAMAVIGMTHSMLVDLKCQVLPIYRRPARLWHWIGTAAGRMILSAPPVSRSRFSTLGVQAIARRLKRRRMQAHTSHSLQVVLWIPGFRVSLSESPVDRRRGRVHSRRPCWRPCQYCVLVQAYVLCTATVTSALAHLRCQCLSRRPAGKHRRT